MAKATYSNYANNTASSWWNDPGLRKNVFFCVGCMLCPYYLGYDQSLLTGLQALPQWNSYFNKPSGNWLGLISSCLFIPPIVFSPLADWVCQKYGRRVAIWIGSVIIIAAAIWNGLCTSAGQFMGARALLGLGGTFTKIGAPALLHEIAHPRLRPIVGTMYYGFYYTGSLTSACLCIAGLHINGSWGWRLPVIFQMLGPIIVLAISIKAPESPRWLIKEGRNDEALAILANFHANGQEDDPLVQWEYAEIVTTLHQEALMPKTRYIDFFKTSGNRRRLLVIVSTSFGGNWVGNGIVSYYLSPVLNQLGITDPNKTTGINAGLALWNLILAQLSGVNIERLGRRKMFLISTAGMIGALCFVMGLSAGYATQGNTAMGIAAIPFLFIFYGFYDIAWTPLPYAYSTEITPYNMRTKGLAIFTISQNSSNFFNQWANPVALAALKWKYYAVYIALDVFWFALIYFYFPETKGLSIEEVAMVFDYGRTGGRKQVAHDLELAIQNEASLGKTAQVEDEQTAEPVMNDTANKKAYSHVEGGAI